jgi:hypothetical protein
MNIIAKSAFALIATVSQAAALSCLAPDMARDFQRIAASEKSYVVLNGTFSFASRPARGDDPRPEMQSFASKFNGKLLTGNGFTDEIADVLITINSNCTASWCGEITPDATYIAFVEQDGKKLTLQAEACPAYAFHEPTEEMVKQIENCAAGKSCDAVN